MVNDGEVTALAGSMSLGKNRMLGISLGTSTAGGYVNAEGNITSWINELAFVPVDYNPGAPTDEWSGDYGCDVQYFSQQCVGRLLAPRGHSRWTPSCRCPRSSSTFRSSWTRAMPAPARFTRPSAPTSATPSRTSRDFYDLENVLILGRVTSGPGGDVILAAPRKC